MLNMKSLQINIIVSSIFLLGVVSVNAQTNKSKSVQKQRTEAKKTIELSNEIPVRKKPTRVVSTTPTTTKTPIRSNAPVGDYLGFEKVIIERSVSGTIPANFPKAKQGQTKEAYAEVMKDWARKNLNQVKEKYHSEILSK